MSLVNNDKKNELYTVRVAYVQGNNKVSGLERVRVGLRLRLWVRGVFVVKVQVWLGVCSGKD